MASEAAVAKDLPVFEMAIVSVPAVEASSKPALDSGAVARRRFVPGDCNERVSLAGEEMPLATRGSRSRRLLRAGAVGRV